MKITLEIPDDKAADLMEVLGELSYVTIEEEKPLLLKELEEAVQNLKLVKEGKMKAKTLDELLDEL